MLLSTYALAQDNSLLIGDPPNSDQRPIRFGFLNLDNLNMHLEIPLASYPVRGHDPITVSAVYDSAMWVGNDNYFDGTPLVGPSASAGMRFVVKMGPNPTAPQNGSSYGTPCSYPSNPASGYSNGTFITYPGTGWTITDPNGTSHPFLMDDLKDVSTCYDYNNSPEPVSDAPPYTTSSYSIDGTGAYLTLNTPNPLYNFEIWSVDGYYTGVTCTLNGCSGVGPETPNGNYGGDTLDATPAPPTGCNASGEAYTNSNPPQPASAGTTETCTMTIPAGASFIVTYTAMPVSTNFFPNDSPDYEDYQENIWLPTSILLPDGSTYTFSYDTGTSKGHYGGLTQIQLPTGGATAYQYSATPFGFLIPLSGMTDNGNQTTITSVGINNSNFDAATTVILPPRPVYGGTSIQDTVKYTFPNNSSDLFQVQQYAGASTLLKTTQYSRPSSGNGSQVTSIVETFAATGQTHEIDY